MSTPVIRHFVGGAEWGPEQPAHFGKVFNPTTGEITKHIAFASADEVSDAIELATGAGTKWAVNSISSQPSTARCSRTRGRGHPGSRRRRVCVRHTEPAQGRLLLGSVDLWIDVYSLRQPLGVCAVISLFNFPAMVLLWFVPTAITRGNAVVLKPSDKDPSAANLIAELWRDAGRPEGVSNVVHGGKEAVDPLLTHPGIASVSFVGSTPIAKYVYETGTAHGERVQVLDAAKNHMLVLPDADLDLAADAAVNAGFGSAGERCMAISVIVAVEPVADELVAKIKERMSGLTTGDGTGEVDMGPLVTGARLNKVTSYVDAGVESGAGLVVDGRGGKLNGDEGGFWLSPTLFDRVTPEMSIYNDEIFGPVLPVLLLLWWLEGLAVRRHPRARLVGRPFLHPREGGHQ